MRYNRREKADKQLEFLVIYLGIRSDPRYCKRLYTSFYSENSSLFRNEIEKFDDLTPKTVYKKYFKEIAKAVISRSVELEKEWGRNRKNYPKKSKPNPKQIPVKIKDLEESIKHFVYY